MVAQTFLEFRASQTPDRSAFNLTHAFTGKPHRLTDFFKRMVVVRADPVAQSQYLRFARLQLTQAMLDFAFHRRAKETNLGIIRLIALHKVNTARIFIVTDRGVDGFHTAHGLREKLNLGT